MVSHELLYEKLENIGIRGTSLQTVKNYLENRMQYIKIGNTVSNGLVLKRGVQCTGTVLGLILFLIYGTDIIKWVGNGRGRECRKHCFLL